MTPRNRLILASVLFSTGGTAIKGVAFDAWQVLAVRAVIAAATLLVLLPEARRGMDWRAVVVGGAYGATATLFVLANKLTTAGHAVFLQNTSPLFVLLLAPWALGERARRSDLGFMAVLAAGMALFFVGAGPRFVTAPAPLLGNALAVGSAVTWAVAIVGYRWLAGRGIAIGAAAVAGNVLAFLFALPFALPLPAGRALDWALLVYLGVVQLGLGYRFIARGLPHVPALAASVILLMEPVLSSLWAWLVHGETIGVAGVAGGAIIVAGTVLHGRLARPHPETVPEA